MNLTLNRSNIFLSLFLFFTLALSYANGQNNRPNANLNINFKNATLVEAFSLIRQQTNLKFSYGEYILSNKKRYNGNYKNKSIKQILNDLSNKAYFDYSIQNNDIIIYEKTQLQSHTITGVITDENGDLLPGASIIEKETTNGVSSNFDGEYTITTTTTNAILVASYIGYETQEIAVNGQQNINISLAPNTALLDEVVVIGYGTTTKEKFNGSVSKVESKALNNFSSANFEQSLAGNVAGVQIASNGKNPGENSVIQIRGVNTLTAGTNPLIVVNGIPLTEGTSFSSINTQDIESVNILKDAASAAIYGSRASNGVILITTKKGRKGNLKVTYDTYAGFQSRIDNFKLVDAYDAALFDFDARNYGYISGGTGRNISDNNATRDANGGGKRSRIPDYLQGYLNKQPNLTNTNWADAVFRNAFQQNHFLNLSGGSDKTNYSVSFGYLSQENIIISSDYERYTSNIQLNSEITDRIKFGISSNISLSNANPTGEAGWSNYSLNNRAQPDPSFSIILMNPYYPVYNSDGSYAISNQLNDHNNNWDGPISENTIAQTELTNFFERQFRFFGNTYLEIDLLKDLKFKTSFGGDFNIGFTEFFAPSTIGNYRTPIANNRTQAFERNIRRENIINENTLAYNKSFNNHNLDVLLGYSFQQENYYDTKVESNNFADNNLPNIAGATAPSSTLKRSKWALESYFARLQYDYNNKYSLSASLRKDGSSRFGVNTKYGTFASLSAGWVVSNETFFPQDGLVNFTKLRVSWGQTGNNQIDDFGAMAIMEQDNYAINGQLISGIYSRTAPNPNLSWETNTAINLGADFGFLNNKILVTAEYYNATTSNLLLNVAVPEQSGFSSSLENVGKLENKGLELEIKGNDFKIGEVAIGFNSNITTNKNKVIELGNGQEQKIENNGGMDFITKKGGSIAQFYAYDIVGVYKTQAEINNSSISPLSGTEIGDYIVRDANGDGKITDADRVELGDYNPEFTYGFGFNVNYKGFDLNAQFIGIEGKKVTDRMLYQSESGEGFTIPTQYYFDNYYNDRNPNGFFRRPDFSSFSSAGRLTRASSLSVYDGDYFRLRSLQLGYNFSENSTKKLKIDALRIYLTGNNIFNSTKYRGYNSDGLDSRNNKSQTLTRGWIQSASPLTRFVALGLNVKF